MKVLAVKDVETYGNLWAVRYTRLTRRGVKQDQHFIYITEEEARQKRAELLDILTHHNGEYVGVKAQQQGNVGRRRSAKQEVFQQRNEGLLQQAVLQAIANGYDFARTTPFSNTSWKKLVPHANDIFFSPAFANALGYKLAALGAWCDEGKDPFQYIAQFVSGPAQRKIPAR